MNTAKGCWFFITLLVVCCTTKIANAQQLNYTLHRDYLWGIERHFNQKETKQQTFVKPYTFQNINQINDSSVQFPRLLKGTKAEEQDKKAKAQLEIYPIIDAGIGFDLSAGKSRLTNSTAIGGNLVGFWKDKWAINIKALGGKAVYNSFVDSIVQESRVVPGLGYAYRSNNDSSKQQYAYQYFSGYVSYAPNKTFLIQAGQDKHFWGDGYRSLFLSDVAAPYPFLKITTNVWNITYVNLYTILKDVTNPSGFKSDWYNKYSTFHYLGWNVTKRINIGLFESIVWQGSDSTRYRGYDVNYLNPIMFFRPTEYSLGSSDNALTGFSFKIKLPKNIQLYGQLLLDEFLLKELKAQNGWWGNKYGIQGGIKCFDLFGFKNLNFQTEYNYVRPYTYSHGSVQQNYGHYNQSLAHPLGANFSESCNFVNYRYKRFFVEAKFIYAAYGADSAGTDYGKNIFISYSQRPKEYKNYVGQGFYTTLITSSLRLACVLDTRSNMKLELGFSHRQQITYNSRKETPYVFLGFTTDLCNLYNDY
jgi:hypothetical protein